MNGVIAATRLHVNKREATFLVPLVIAAAVAAISIVIELLFWRSGSVPGSPGWIQGSRSNPGLPYALVSFLAYLGVQSVSTTFPFALTLGSTRRAFAAGVLVWDAIVAAYLTVILGALMLIELATNHWLFGFYIFDVYVLGAGDLGLLVPIVFLGTLTVLMVGGVFGASWTRFGARGPIGLAIVVGLAIVIALIIVLPALPAMLAGFQIWWLAVAAGVAIVLSGFGIWLLLRPATVR